jgi:hypothetical protein
MSLKLIDLIPHALNESQNSQNQGRSTYQIPYFFSFLYSVEMFKMGRRK